MKTAVFYEHILEGAKQSGKSVAELMEKCAFWNIRGIEIGDALLRENKEEIKELLEKNHMQVSCSNAFYDFGHNPDAAQGKKQIDLAEEFGVSKVLIIPGELSENEAAALNALSASKEQTDSYMSENASNNINKLHSVLKARKHFFNIRAKHSITSRLIRYRV